MFVGHLWDGMGLNCLFGRQDLSIGNLCLLGYVEWFENPSKELKHINDFYVAVPLHSHSVSQHIGLLCAVLGFIPNEIYLSGYLQNIYRVETRRKDKQYYLPSNVGGFKPISFQIETS